MITAEVTAMSLTLWGVLGTMGYYVANFFATDDAKRKKFIAVQIIVILVSEVFVTTTLAGFFYGTAQYEYARFVASTAEIMIIMSSLHLLMGVRYEKIFFVVAITDIWRFLCCYVAGVIITAITGTNSRINEFYEGTAMNYVRIIIVLILALATILPIKKFSIFIADHNMKYPMVGKVLVVIYFLSALVRNLVPITAYGYVVIPEIAIAVIIISMLCNYTFHYENNKMSATLELLEYERNVMSNYCDMLDNQINQTKKIRHDFRNNFQVIQTLCEQGEYDELRRYLGEWKGYIDDAKIKKYSDIQIINASLTQKEKICKGLNIRFDVDMNNISRGEVSEFDLNTIIFNLIDNAINGCKAVSEEERFISLKCKNVYNQLVIIVNNSCNTDRPYIRKDDDVEHGIGLTIVNSIVKKYDGNVNIEDKKNLYRVDINLNVQPN